MGKTTGFLEYARTDAPDRPPEERVWDWNEFHQSLPSEERARQGGRCMDCGTPFCQAGIAWQGQVLGCPLHNLIPEWNDMVYTGNYTHALERLLKTNNFPEFTGRVCPAPCEDACLCGLGGRAVTIRDNERAIIEQAFARRALSRPRPSRSSDKKVAVVGSGPAGLAAADQLNHRGHWVTVVERLPRPGGLLTYGIPNMKLPKDVVFRRIEQMTDEGVSFVTGLDAADPATAQRLLAEYDAVILCCGAWRPRPLGLEDQGVSGICYGIDFLKAAVERKVFGLDPAVPTAAGLHVVVIGTGDTASDCVATALRQGCASITQLVRRPREDYLDAQGNLPLSYAHEEALALTGRDPRRFSSQVQSLETDGEGALTGLITSQGDRLPCQLLIGATGFAGCEENVCRAFGVQVRDTVCTPPGRCSTNVETVIAAGDRRRVQSLVVWAIAEGRAAAAEVDAYLNGYTSLVSPGL